MVGKHKLIDKPCEDCGVLMIGVPPMRKLCDACAKKRTRNNQDRRRVEERRLNMVRDTASPISNPHEKYCKGCHYWGGNNDSCSTCNYIFMEGKMRPCPPGKGCTVRKNKKQRKGAQ